MNQSGLASQSVVDLTGRYGMEILRSLLVRLQDNPFFKSDTSKQVVSHECVGAILSDEQLEGAANSLLLEIREHGFEKFAELELPKQNDIIAHRCSDKKTGFSVRVMRMYSPSHRDFVNRFCIGIA